jgi:SAM-dependent methyltransferase
MTIDFGRTASDYATHRQGLPPAYWDLLQGWGLLRPGSRAVDLGAGTGAVANGLSLRGLQVMAVEPSAALAAHLAGPSWVQARAEDTGIAPGVALVTAAQCWHWFYGAAAAAEVHRLLRPGGHVVVATLDWSACPLVDGTVARIRAANPAWPPAPLQGTQVGLMDRAAQDLSAFGPLERVSVPVVQTYSRAAWRGRIRSSAGIGASLPPHRVDAFDADLARFLEGFPDPMRVPHRLELLMGVRS